MKFRKNIFSTHYLIIILLFISLSFVVLNLLNILFTREIIIRTKIGVIFFLFCYFVAFISFINYVRRKYIYFINNDYILIKSVNTKRIPFNNIKKISQKGKVAQLKILLKEGKRKTIYGPPTSALKETDKFIKSLAGLAEKNNFSLDI